MTIAELRTQLLALTPAEKAEAIQTLIQTLGNGSLGITKTPGVCGGDACIANTRIPLWSVINYRRLGAGDRMILEAFPHLTAADLVNVWAYAEAHPEEIERAIQENEAIMQGDEED